MPQTKRGGDYLTRSSDKNKRTSNGVETIESTISGTLHSDCIFEEQIDSFCDSGQGVWSELSEEVASNLSRSVVSLVLSNGKTVLFACSGIAIERQLNVGRFLTSAALVGAFDDELEEDHDRLEIQVHHEGNVATGCIGDYEFDREIAVVNITTSLDVHAVDLNHHVEFLPHSKVIALGRSISGILMAERGILIGNSSGSGESEELMFSTCKIPDETWAGGPLFDFDGNFVGINLLLVKDRTSFLSANLITERQKKFLQRRRTKRVLINWVDKCSSSEIQKISTPYYSYDRDSFDYPKPSKTVISDGMILVNTFEETFGDVYCSGKGVWSELGTKVSSNLCQTVVSLASFNGETRFFACTGLFIEWNGCTTILTSASLVRDPDDVTEMAASVRVGAPNHDVLVLSAQVSLWIAANLRIGVPNHDVLLVLSAQVSLCHLQIEVLLPNKQRQGILQHCNLHYNVALVSVKDFRALRSANILQHQDQHSRYPNVVAIGRCFESGILMATCGKLVPWSGKLGYNLEYSTCKITKAGIGGPVVDFDGKFVGMNFYDKEIGTPYLSWNTILEALAPFENKRTVVEVESDVNPRRWPVPTACWCHPEFVSELRDDGSEDDNGEYKYRYVNGDELIYLLSVKLHSPPVV